MFPWNLFPINKDMKNMMKQVKPEEIEKHIEEMMSKMFPPNMQDMINPKEFASAVNPVPHDARKQSIVPLEEAVFETHDFVFVRIPIRNQEWLHNMKLSHTSNQMIVEHIPEDDDKHTITLPALVRKKGATAHHKDGILEIRIPKSVNMQFSEIDITDVL
ncbi:Hsp20/alpha crystallin family protein [Bacillus sp. V33-4]|uniref:Hsp20/alpha crystallin family protein n=1 Tax=Bacillus sp. V33-4 TaxID=2054169 RepID=UPI000C7792E6|nr:Hsp20/alpha crystallin family protein [Bacillus sp. V33-4]PLR81612.1 spore coat protein [Bacillus sp. V33-4]